MNKKIAKNTLLLFLIIAGLFYRFYGLGQNYSFWTDENHVAIFARAILERGRPILVNGYHTGAYQWLLYWLSAASMKVFGVNEFAARLPVVIFGVLTIFAVYLLGKEIFNKKVGLIAAFLTTFLNIEILFSRQARPYQMLQFFYLLGACFALQASSSKHQASGEFWYPKFILGFLGCGIMASLFHGLGLVIFFNGFLFLLITNFHSFKKWVLLTIPLFCVFGYFFKVQLLLFLPALGKIDNLFYYRVFLTHNYLPLMLLAMIGGLFLLTRLPRFFRGEARNDSSKRFLLFVVFLGVQMFIVSFLLGQPFTRYLYPVFPFVILLASYGLVELSQLFSSLILRSIFQSHQSKASFPISLILLLILVFTITLQNKIAIVPQKIYSLNADMQEIPEVDWKKIYQFVGKKLKKNQDAILITNWNDLPIWYLGESINNLYIAKKIYNNALSVDPVSSATIIYSLDKLKGLIKESPRGIVVFDSWDSAILPGAREYAQENLKKELEIDRLYPTQPRYWPVSVYSWGIE